MNKCGWANREGLTEKVTSEGGRKVSESCLKEEHPRNSKHKGPGMPGKVKEQQKVGRVLLEWDRKGGKSNG